MAINKQKKEELVAEFTEMVAGAKAMVFVSFKTLSVNKTVALRKKLHNENVGYKVTKKTLLKRALEAQKTEGEFPEVLGELAVAYSADALTPARLMFEAMKENKGKMEILGGVFEGKFMNKAEFLLIRQQIYILNKNFMFYGQKPIFNAGICRLRAYCFAAVASTRSPSSALASAGAAASGRPHRNGGTAR